MSRVRSGVGTSELGDSDAAGRRAASDAMARLAGARPALVLVYASVRYDLSALLAGVRETTGNAPLAGASSCGHFHNGSVTVSARGVAVLVLSAGQYQFGITTVGMLREDAFHAGRALVEAARAAAPTKPHAGLVLFSSGLTCDQQALLNGIHRATGDAVPVVGGVASDDLMMRETFVFHDDQVLTNSAVAVWIASDHPLRVVHGHGWRQIGAPHLVTGVDGRVIRTIASRPAYEVVYEDFSRTPQSPLALPIAGAPAVPVPDRYGVPEAGRALGLIDSDGGLRMRSVCPAEAGEIRSLAPVPPYSAVVVMSCAKEDLLGVCDRIVDSALADRTAAVLLAFSCAMRYALLADEVAEEALRLHQAAGAADSFGFYTYGEFARTTGAAGFHNVTITAMAL